ncbi:hypothetical protein Acid345_4441 [Candidatus Koribacter versatilis Ellin345]|uniref:Uncharacterized protein n=1 Tax=Koribacter versatilis (strain Ellin345) TaxID=204669 RepID=Q1II59_KORVE|nr:hypothetical protein [Candidatus Koribacter versatilis]ABF43441.1 hypothetical protein Acid345_4441 [Candidatus Koribacter versatilis Ellin345]
MKSGFLLVVLLAGAIAFAQETSNAASSRYENQNPRSQDPPMLGIHWAKGVTPPASPDARVVTNARRTANMTYHGGVIMPTANTYSIFWGTTWGGYSGDKMSGIDSYYAGFINSNYAKTSDEYTGSNGQVGAGGTSHNHVVDTSASAGGNNTTTILNEVCKEITNGALPLDGTGNGYYAVYADKKRGSAGYCAWHSSGSCNGKRIEFAYFFNLDGDAGCDPQDTQTGHSQGLAAIANVSGHELSEARSDPASPGAWYDSSGAENGDKCAWTFNVAHVTFSNGTIWKIQGEWSNAAYTAGTGYPNSSGQKGCLDGH